MVHQPGKGGSGQHRVFLTLAAVAASFGPAASALAFASMYHSETLLLDA